ncbi:RNA-binding protein 34-like [Montipora capricornis]|uniref:RNA-binding protein 34-like n=1 Tax=Montipora capricornis TaxID=246305 RepID=UPI0035F15EDF
MAVANGLSGYKVGEISQVLLSKQREKKKEGKENAKLSALFSSANVFQPQFVSLTTKKSERKVESTGKTQINQNGDLHVHHVKEDQKETGETFSHGKRKRKVPTSDDEDDETLVKKSFKKRKKSVETEEDPERLARTVFVGNLPVAFTGKKLKKLFAVYGKVESVRFRSAALAQPNFSRKVAMKKKEFHADRHNINGYVVFKEKECAFKALKSNGMEVDGLHIRVDLTRKIIDKHDHARSIFVGNLPFNTEEEELRQTFVDCGCIEAVRVVRDSKTNIGKGFGFILFKEKEAVMFALKKNKTDFHGRPLRIFPSSENPKQAQSKEAKKGQAKAFSFSGITAKRGQKKEHKGKKKPGFENGKKGSQVLDRKPVKKQRFKKQASVKKQSSKNMNRKSKTSKGNLKQSFKSSTKGNQRR